MSKLKNWLYNLKIKWKLMVILFVTVFNFIIFYAFSTFLLNTTSVYTSLIDAERLHTQYFETGLASFYRHLNTKDTAELNKSISNLNKANRLASLMVDIDSIVDHSSSSQIEEIFWDYYKEPLHYDRNAVNLFAHRTSLFVKFNFKILVETFAIAAEGARTGTTIVELIKEYDRNPSPETLLKIDDESETIRKFYVAFSDKINEATTFGMKLQFYSSAFMIILLILFTIYAINVFSGYLQKQLKLLIEESQKLARGNLNTDIRKPSNDEIGWLFDAFGEIVSNMKQMVAYASKISQGEYNTQLTPRSENDELVIALNTMATSLQSNKLKNDIEAWQTSGLNNLNKEISGNLSLEDFTHKTMSFLLDYLMALGGNFYTLSNESLQIQVSAGMNTVKIPQVISMGSGVIGQAALDNKTILLKDLHDKNYNTFTSSGEISPKELLIVPLQFNGKILGIIELTSVNTFSAQHLEFVKIIKDIISVGLHVTIARQQLKELLETTQAQAEELEVQQEELRTTNAELEEQTQLLRENELKLQAQQEELRVTNEELEERTHDLEMQRNEVIKNSAELEKAKIVVEQKAREVEIASKYKSVFLANMSHELRTPLNSLLILSKDLSENRENNLTKSQIESAIIINNSGYELLNLINDILDLSKIEAGKMIVNPEYISPDDLNGDITNMFKHVAQNKGLFFTTQLELDPKHSLYNDRQKIDQILKNLISNALKFTSNGGVSVIFRLSEENNDVLCIDVVDTGIGIPRDKQEEIFEAFKQVDGSISRNFGGTGLGLSISRELAKLLNGRISLTSEPSKGSTFTVCIPINFTESSTVEIPVQTPETVKVAHEIRSHTEDIQDLQANKNEDDVIFVDDDRHEIRENDKVILIIEDDLILAKSLVKQCRESGFKCLVSGSGENGLYVTDKYKPDAIILDIMLPGMDGYQVLEILKENPETRHIPVQMMSSLDPESSTFQKWAIGYLSKPLKQEDIVGALEKISLHINKNVKDLLVVEDDDDNRLLISKMLGGKDVNLSLSSSGKEALKLITEKSFDCVVLDLGLADMSGIDLVKEINKTCKNKLPPIIVYTARELTKDETKELQRYTKSIIIKGTKSDSRLLDETALFLHRVVDDMSESKKQIIKKLHNKEAVFENKTVLVVDDDMRNVFALTKILEDRHLNVIEAENGKIALEKLSGNQKIDIVLMDVMMPVMDGLTAIKKIRENLKHSDLPIIVLTAKAMKEDRIKAIEAGANDYLSKPLDTEKLLSLMRVWLFNSK
jgi:CheY-like chemotaxis protein/HAMP domain-containing protein